LQLTLKELFQYQTVAELARISGNAHDAQIEQKMATAPRPLEKAMTTDAVKPSLLVTTKSLRAYGREALEKAGLSPEGAAIVTEVQLETSLRGQRTHNMDSIPRYARRISSGVTNPQPRIRIEHETSISARVDGDNGPGQWVGVIAMQTAIQKAKQTGVGMVSARRSNHFGAAAHYAWMAALEGLIGLCTTNGPVILAPTGGVTPTFGNNPLAVGIPAARYTPILLDIAMSVAPRGKIGLQLAEGKTLLPGWILDHLGRPSTDPADLAAGLGVPIGGHKGYGLALVMEAMAGVLSGAGFCRDHSREQMYKDSAPPDFGHFFMAIDPELFMPSAEFMARVDRMIEQTKSAELAQNAHEILIPGEAELRARERNMLEGVPLLPSAYRMLLRYGEAAGLNTKLEVVKFLGTLTEE
jgi:LDH2 family malate/lactate/ureidoglycolate dehydrogenase